MAGMTTRGSHKTALVSSITWVALGEGEELWPRVPARQLGWTSMMLMPCCAHAMPAMIKPCSMPSCSFAAPSPSFAHSCTRVSTYVPSGLQGNSYGWPKGLGIGTRGMRHQHAPPPR
eukprot:scaffold7756_cov17-Tisochrysis_lutea.AAC.1